MARILHIDGFDEVLRKRLLRSFQSGNINFLIGSGASSPAIPIAGSIETEIADLLDKKADEEAEAKLFGFLVSIQEPTNKLLKDPSNAQIALTLQAYEDFLRNIEEILLARRTTLLPRQVNIFCTNYDLFIERASSACPRVILNDGFSRSAGLRFGMDFSSRNFFRATYDTGNLYEYKVEIPGINLIKLHGSCSWEKGASGIAFRSGDLEIPEEEASGRKKFISCFGVVLPQATKFRETLMDRTYYDLLRIYSNSLERENSVLLTFGFSFGDEHIRDITTRALKNPTLRLMLYAYDDAACARFAQMFEMYNNVEIISSGNGSLGFKEFNESIRHVLHAPQVTA